MLGSIYSRRARLPENKVKNHSKNLLVLSVLSPENIDPPLLDLMQITSNVTTNAVKKYRYSKIRL